MGYLVTAHVSTAKPNMAALRSLPSSIGWAIHHQVGEPAYYVDAFRAGRPPSWPFTSMPPTKDISLDLPAEFQALSVIYAALEEARLADGFNRGFLNLNLAVSKALQMPVCSFCSDDDGVDFAAVSDTGQLSRLHCQCGDLDIVFEGGRVVVQPLVLEDEGGATDMMGVNDPANGIFVLERNVDYNPLLHRVASDEVTKFLGLERPPLGLGGSDDHSPPRIEQS